MLLFPNIMREMLCFFKFYKQLTFYQFYSQEKNYYTKLYWIFLFIFFVFKLLNIMNIMAKHNTVIFTCKIVFCFKIIQGIYSLPIFCHLIQGDLHERTSFHVLFIFSYFYHVCRELHLAISYLMLVALHKDNRLFYCILW